MDNLSHTLTGLALARAGLNRLAPGATAVLLISANAPDADIVTLLGGQLRYLEVHRGYTHSFFCLPVVAFACTVVVAAFLRRRTMWLRLWLLACLGVGSHLLLDWTNSYGIRLLLPFSSRWFHGDLNSLYDGFFLLVLGVAALWPLLANLVSGEIGQQRSDSRGIAVAALLAIAAFECGRAVLHNRAVAELQVRVYDELSPLESAALPDPFNPLRWTGIVETETSWLRVPIEASGNPDLHAIESFYKLPATPVLMAAKQTEPFRFLSYFARFPVWSAVPVPLQAGTGWRVELTDLRFGTPGSGSFAGVALETGKAQVLQSDFTWGAR